jgi:hypothetical protein
VRQFTGSGLVRLYWTRNYPLRGSHARPAPWRALGSDHRGIRISLLMRRFRQRTATPAPLHSSRPSCSDCCPLSSSGELEPAPGRGTTREACGRRAAVPGILPPVGAAAARCSRPGVHLRGLLGAVCLACGQALRSSPMACLRSRSSILPSHSAAATVMAFSRSSLSG